MHKQALVSGRSYRPTIVKLQTHRWICLISKLQGIGLTPSDIHNLEYLDNREVLEHLPGGFRWLKKNTREDVILYFETFADLLEEKLLSGINILPLFEEQIENNPAEKELNQIFA